MSHFLDVSIELRAEAQMRMRIHLPKVPVPCLKNTSAYKFSQSDH